MRVALVSIKGIKHKVVKQLHGVMSLTFSDAEAGSLRYLKLFGGTEQRNIPSSYTQLEYVDMKAGSYIKMDNLPIYSGYRVEFDFQTTTVSSLLRNYLGGRASGVSAGGGFRLSKLASSNSSGVVLYGFDAGTEFYDRNNPITANTRYKYSYNNGVCTLETNGAVYSTKTFTVTDNTSTKRGINSYVNGNNTTTDSDEIYVYSVKVRNTQGKLVLDYIPATDGTDIGLYDKVSGTLVTATEGTITAGPTATPTPDTPIDIVSNNGVLKVNAQGNIYTSGTTETIEDELSNTATAEMLLKVGDYQDEQEVLSGNVTRKVGVRVFDGTESWTYFNNASYPGLFYSDTAIVDNMVDIPFEEQGICSHLEGVNTAMVTTGQWRFQGNVAQGKVSTNRIYFCIDTSYTTVAEMQQYLADQYANGTPVIVIYPLATPTTETVAGQTINVKGGNNTIEITQASLDNLELEIEYKGDPV